MNSQKLKKLDFFIEKSINLLNSKMGKSVINKIYKHSLYNDEPKIFAYSAIYGQKNESKKDIASGFSFNQKIAIARVLGESIERYCLDNYKPIEEVIDSEEALNYNHLSLFKNLTFSTNQLKKNEFKKFRILTNSKFSWIEALSLLEKNKILVPSQLISMDTDYLKNENIIRFPISTGAATSVTLNDAIYRGACEVVERDSFMISYLNKLSSPKVDLKKLDDLDIGNILKIFERYRLELVIIDITTDLKIPAFAALVIDRTGLGPSVSLGLKAGFNIKDTIIGAIEESLMTRSWIRDKFVYMDPNYKENKEIISIEDRAHFWLSTNKIKYLDFWLNSKNESKIDLNANKNNAEDQLDRIANIFKKHFMNIIYVDITDSRIRRKGFFVVKVIIPELQSLYLDERYPYFGAERLYRVPVVMGLLSKAKKEKDLNIIPHPFL